MCAILPIHARLVNQSQIGFVHQRGGAQCVVRALGAQLTVGNRAQLLVDQRDQAIERFRTSTPGIPEQIGYRSGLDFHRSISGRSNELRVRQSGTSCRRQQGWHLLREPATRRFQFQREHTSQWRSVAVSGGGKRWRVSEGGARVPVAVSGGR